ncbi:MAG: SlyX family protein [Thiohalocapsa sp.]|nr:SlyX family protein [Thiohalocapsa sp.]MCF7990213.1 SlyX family protein [Thiohalocapsa sp.]
MSNDSPSAPAAPDSGSLSALEAAVEDLQMRVTYQEDEIRHLNLVLERQRTTLDAQSLQIEKLRHLVASMAEGLREQTIDVKPPHY